jgi:hypothetical protein
MSKNSKWFYKLQNEAEDKILKDYEIIGYCNYQVITPNIVFEKWSVRRLTNGVSTTIMVVMYKQTGFIEIYESK